MPEERQITYARDGHKHVFCYEEGDESQVLDALIEKVNDKEFDWFDAAVVSHELGQHLAKDLKKYLPKRTDG